MLILTRREGEGLRIGENTKLTVLNIEKNKIKLCINGTKEVTISKWKKKEISDGIIISAEKITANQVKLGIKGPKSVSIKREEIFEKDLKDTPEQLKEKADDLEK